MSAAIRPWLEELGLARYADRFEADDIDLDVLPSLSEQDLEKLGVSRVIFPEREMAIRVAHSLVMPNALDYIELSRDFSWIRLRGSLLLASGDADPYDDKATGFDAIFENPQFAGADTSYWVRQTIPFAGGGRAVSVNGRNGILNSLRSSKEQGQSNFVNPGLVLLGIGADLDLKPELRLTANLNHLRFMHTGVLGALRNEAPPPKEIGPPPNLTLVGVRHTVTMRIYQTKLEDSAKAPCTSTIVGLSWGAAVSATAPPEAARTAAMAAITFFFCIVSLRL